jgi:DNA-directed RNA polymerase subunit omega
MINIPSIDRLAEKVGSKYALCVIASKRARQLIDHAQNQGLTDLPNHEKPLTAAAKEIDEGKVTVSKY